MSLETRNSKLETTVSRWPHRLALLLCCATFPLVWVGGLVTSTDAGMAFRDWPTSSGYFLFFYPWLDWLRGPWDMFVEHGHRMFAALVGLLTIAFCISVWRTASPRWMRMLGIVAVVGVVFQGCLGGLRVLMDERTLAMIHGCVGPAFFAFTAALAVVTSRRWRDNFKTVDLGSAGVVPAMPWAVAIVTYVQIMAGAQVRHFKPEGSPATFRTFVLFHAVLGVCLALMILTTAVLFWRKVPHVKPLALTATLLATLAALQLALGAATWVNKYGWPAFLADSAAASNFTVEANSWRQMQITTAHVAMGSLILGVATILALLSSRMIKTHRRLAAAGSTTSIPGMAA